MVISHIKAKKYGILWCYEYPIISHHSTILDGLTAQFGTALRQEPLWTPEDRIYVRVSSHGSQIAMDTRERWDKKRKWRTYPPKTGFLVSGLEP